MSGSIRTAREDAFRGMRERLERGEITIPEPIITNDVSKILEENRRMIAREFSVPFELLFPKE